MASSASIEGVSPLEYPILGRRINTVEKYLSTKDNNNAMMIAHKSMQIALQQVILYGISSIPDEALPALGSMIAPLYEKDRTRMAMAVSNGIKSIEWDDIINNINNNNNNKLIKEYDSKKQLDGIEEISDAASIVMIGPTMGLHVMALYIDDKQLPYWYGSSIHQRHLKKVIQSNSIDFALSIGSGNKLMCSNVATPKDMQPLAEIGIIVSHVMVVDPGIIFHPANNPNNNNNSKPNNNNNNHNSSTNEKK